jgi:flagellar hook-associated protein FlgK
LTVTVGAGTYRAGDRFGVGLHETTGAVLDPATGLAGPHVQTSTWSAANPALSIKGRYGNTLSDPALGWSMRVVTAGVVGAKAGTAAPNNPPVVQFTVWTGTSASPVQQTIVKTLDDSLRAGQPINLVDGVYATVGAGTFATAGEEVAFTVDGDPDQAGLLPALGINQLLRCDGTAASVELDEALVDDPTRLTTGTTREEGDNSNVVRQLGLRREASFGTSGSFRFEDAYLGIISDVGVRVDETGRQGENQDSLKASLQHQRDSVSGISIDDEVGALILQQQAYGAAAKMVSAARENIQTLLDILR